ncbi:hypothetical protein NFA_41800 [Nocardia farcinica IFM 10152]|uniref:Uncharacterized protein n=1 Tax=Nocardia farcinica (strain IFM 10152) TaxID=247156 RepID=Q5YS12_NOCFA|nr:hypothetical protein NFA_41800 [Nocardia farcinica IFM 10152]
MRTSTTDSSRSSGPPPSGRSRVSTPGKTDSTSPVTGVSICTRYPSLRRPTRTNSHRKAPTGTAIPRIASTVSSGKSATRNHSRPASPPSDHCRRRRVRGTGCYRGVRPEFTGAHRIRSATGSR